MLPAARAARATLLASGRRVSRDALAGQLRADGYPAANAVISAVHQALSADAGADEGDDVDARDGGLVTNTRSPDGYHPDTSATPEVVGAAAPAGP